MHHKSEDSQLGGAAVVELDGTLGHLGLSIEGVPAEVNESVTEVTNEFISSSLNVLHEGKFKGANEGNNLEKSSSRDGIRAGDGCKSIRVGCEGVTGHVNVTWKVESGAGGDLSQERKLADTSVLDLDVTETVELLLVTIADQAERIEESKRRLGTELTLERLEGGSLGGRLGWGESSSGGDEGGDDDRLHGCYLAIYPGENCEKALSLRILFLSAGCERGIDLRLRRRRYKIRWKSHMLVYMQLTALLMQTISRPFNFKG